MSAPSNNRITELMVAASRGDLPRVEALPRDGAVARLEELLDAGVDPNALLRDEWTALMVAERKGYAEVARILRTGWAEKPLPALIRQPAAAGQPHAPDVDLSDFPDHIKD